MLKILKKLFIFSLIISLFLLSSCTDTKDRRKNELKDVYELYLAHASQQDTVTDIFASKFASLVEEKSNNKIKINIYPNGQLGNDIEITEALQRGNITFVVQTTAPQVSFVPELSIFDIPMAFKNLNIARKVLDSRLSDELKRYYEEKKIVLLAFADQGYRVMSSNKKINIIDDLKNIKIRTMENPNHILFWKKTGANPTPMAWSEVYVALQQGVIESQENPIETIVASKVYEQQKYIVNTNHILHTLSLIGSKDVLDALPQDLQKIIQESAHEAKIYARKQTDERSNSRIQIIKESGTKIIPYDEKLFEDMKNSTIEVWDEVEKKVGKNLLDILKKEIEQAQMEDSNENSKR